jgi:hypothetical protein
MTAYLARRVAARLNRLKVPGCALDSPLGELIWAWTNNGGQLVVISRDGGRWVIWSKGGKHRAPVWVPDEKGRAK